MELLCYWNLMDWLRPFIRKAISLVLGDCLRDLEQIDQMAGPRIIKSHLPLYLLNPQVLSTSKVSLAEIPNLTTIRLSLTVALTFTLGRLRGSQPQRRHRLLLSLPSAAAIPSVR
jgi:hypothetical protein